jgi:hypothetical protein
LSRFVERSDRIGESIDRRIDLLDRIVNPFRRFYSRGGRV